MLLQLCTNSFPPFLRHNVLQTLLFVAMHEKRGTFDATADHVEVLDVGATAETGGRKRSCKSSSDGE